MPRVLYVLALAVFAQATSEFMLSGLVVGIAADLHVSLAAAGSLTSAFAVGMIVGAPLMALLSLRLSRRRALLGFLAVFLLVHVAGALTGDYAVLLGTRVLAALSNAGFLAVALGTATGLAPAGRTGRATAVLLAGTTIACVAGVPAGAVLGEVFGWRAAFWAVAIVCVPAFAGIAVAVPPGTGGAGNTGARAELRALRAPRLRRALALGALVNGGTFAAFTYLAPLGTAVAGLGAAWVPVLLALFGLGSFAGVTAAGRIADERPARVLALGGSALLAGWVALALCAGSAHVLVPLVFVQGALAFGVGSTLIAQALYAAPDAPTLGGGFATAALNVGAAAGPWFGGLAIDAGYGYRAPVWLAAILVTLALLLAATARRAVRI